MQFQASAKSRLSWTGDCLVVGICEADLPLSGPLSELDSKVSGLLQELIEENDFTGKAGSSAVIRIGRDGPMRKLAVIGLGDGEQLSYEGLRRGSAAAAKLAKKERCQVLGLDFPKVEADAALSAQAITEGVILALHEDTRYKSDGEKATSIDEVHLLDLAGQEAAIKRAEDICSGVILARELVSAPPNVVTPEFLAQTAQEIAHDHSLEIEVLEQEDCEKLGMGAYLGVGQASELPPKFIHLTYRPSGNPKRKLAIIGKGLTFDSGGLNLKPSGSGIEMMKIDMGGAAATFGAAKAIAQIKPEVEVHFISAATENMISGRALHPGDILTASNGKTIEVNNTDAEGRLTLADALVFADKLGLDAILDLATLTGACMIALGDDIAGLFSPHEDLAAEVLKAAETSGEKLWRMPMEEAYFEGMRSVVADMKNTGPRPGGAITAALFLKQFVKDTPWAHLDVAGPVWTEKENGYRNPGGTGYGVRTLVQWVLASA